MSNDTRADAVARARMMHLGSPGDLALLRERATSGVTIECVLKKSCLEPEVNELSAIVLALLADRDRLTEQLEALSAQSGEEPPDVRALTPSELAEVDCAVLSMIDVLPPGDDDRGRARALLVSAQAKLAVYPKPCDAPGFEDDPYTMGLTLCDPDGIVRRGRFHKGIDYTCTGHAHFAGAHIECLSEAHRAPEEPKAPRSAAENGSLAADRELLEAALRVAKRALERIAIPQRGRAGTLKEAVDISCVALGELASLREQGGQSEKPSVAEAN